MSDIADWGAIDPRPFWSCFTEDAATKAHTLWWIGQASCEDEAAACALRAAACARTIADAIENLPPNGRSDAIQSCGKIHDTDRRPSIQVCKGMTVETMIEARRAMRRSSTFSGRAAAAIGATFELAAAHATLPEGMTACVDFGFSHGETHIGHGIGVTDRQTVDPRFPALPSALREALEALNVAFWMSGAPPEGAGPMPSVTGHASSTLAAAQRATLLEGANANLAIVRSLLERLKLHEQARALAELYA